MNIKYSFVNKNNDVAKTAVNFHHKLVWNGIYFDNSRFTGLKTVNHINCADKWLYYESQIIKKNIT